MYNVEKLNGFQNFQTFSNLFQLIPTNNSNPTYIPFFNKLQEMFDSKKLIWFKNNNFFSLVNVNLESVVKAVIGIVAIVLIFKVIDDIANAKPQPQLVLVKEQPKQRKDFSKSTKEEVLARQGYRCNSCGQYSSLFDFHHKNGDRSNNCSSNCEALCPLCHAKKTRRKF